MKINSKFYLKKHWKGHRKLDLEYAVNEEKYYEIIIKRLINLNIVVADNARKNDYDNKCDNDDDNDEK